MGLSFGSLFVLCGQSLLWVLAANGVLSRVDGLILVIGAIAYTVAVIGPRDARGAKL